MRIIVTGSRDLADALVVRRALWALLPEEPDDLTVVHGDCPTGADRHASNFCADYIEEGVIEERHPADWSIGKKAGPLRNQEMVDLGADLVLAFPRGLSRGTRDTISRAKVAGIPVEVWEC